MTTTPKPTTEAQYQAVCQFLKEKGVIVEDLFILYTGTDQLLGEDDGRGTSEVTLLKNPKRVIRLQQVANGGLVLSFLIGDLDLLEEGEITVKPTSFYRVMSQPIKSQLTILSLYKEYFERKVESRAQEAGLVVPPSIVSPFRK